MTTTSTHTPGVFHLVHKLELQDPASANTPSISSLDFSDQTAAAGGDDITTSSSAPIAAFQHQPPPSLDDVLGDPLPGVDGAPPLVVQTAGSGLVFRDSFTTDDTLAYENCVIAAEKQLEEIITSSVTINMVFDMGDSGDTDFNHFDDGYLCNYATLKAALLKHAPEDAAALPAKDPTNGGMFNLAPAYARMLGLTNSTPTVDATVTFHSNGASWDFGQDVINAVTHGISEAGMGRVSGLGVLINDDGVVTPDADGWEPLDLFRYTASGVADPHYDSNTDYFSADGGLQTSASAGLSFNDDETGGDPDDWRQNAVFGGNVAGETLTLTPTDLDVMSALGWTVNLKQQVFTAIAGNWESPTSWANGYNPIAAQDVAIGGQGEASALLSNDVTVNSIAVAQGSALTITDDATLIATDGAVPNSADTVLIFSGNLGVINVEDGATLEFGDSFYNAGTLNVETGALKINGDVTVYNTGAINLGNSLSFNGDISLTGEGSFNLGLGEDQGYIAGSTTNSLFTNVDDTISGIGFVQSASFDNQSGGTIDAGAASSSGGVSDNLAIEAATVSNEGAIDVVANAALDLFTPGASGSLVNADRIDIASQGELAIGANYTISGAGSINLKGAGADIASVGDTPWTLTNRTEIAGFSSQAVIGENSAGGGLLALDNQGVIVADLSGELTINTGAHVVQDAGGTLEAEDNAQLLIDSVVHTGSLGVVGDPVGGTVEAVNGGVVTIGAAVSDGIRSPEYSLSGQVEINGGTVNVLSTGSISIPIEFTGANGTLEIHSGGSILGAIDGVASDDAFSVTGTSLVSVAIGSSSLAIVTNSESLDFTNVGYDDAVTGYVAFADPSAAGMERVVLTDGNGPALSLSDSTIWQQAASTSLTGAGDTIDFEGAGDATLLEGTGGKADKINGSAGAIILDDAEAQVVGGGDRISLRGTAGNAANLFATAGDWDTVDGADGIVYLNSAQADVSGAADTVHFESGVGNQVDLFGVQGSSDTVEGSDGLVTLNDTLAKVAGGGDTIDFAGASGNEANLFDTANILDLINGSNGTVFLNSAQASIVGGGDTIDFSSGSGNIANLSGTGSTADIIAGAAGRVNFRGVTATVNNSGDELAFSGANAVGLVGTAELLAFGPGIGGLDSITGVGASDSFQFSKTDFADFAAMQAHMTQSGANTVISLGASDAVTLVGVSASSLTSARFAFV